MEVAALSSESFHTHHFGKISPLEIPVSLRMKIGDMVHKVKKIIKGNALLARLARAILDNQHLWQGPGLHPYGFRFVGNRSMTLGNFEPEETKLITDQLFKTDVFINVGANIGYYCCLALQAGKRTVAVEPMHRNLKCLYRNFTLNGWEHDSEVYPLALGDRAGLIRIYGGGKVASLVKGWSGTPSGYSHWVPVATFDQLFAHRYSGQRCFVLIDVEGAELDLLRGAASFLIREPRPTWMVEITIDEHLPEGQKVNPNLLETFQYFWSSGYEARTANHSFRLIEEAEIKKIVETGVNTIKTHNFYFSPSIL